MENEYRRVKYRFDRKNPDDKKCRRDFLNFQDYFLNNRRVIEGYAECRVKFAFEGVCNFFDGFGRERIGQTDGACDFVDVVILTVRYYVQIGIHGGFAKRPDFRREDHRNRIAYAVGRGAENVRYVVIIIHFFARRGVYRPIFFPDTVERAFEKFAGKLAFLCVVNRIFELVENTV